MFVCVLLLLLGVLTLTSYVARLYSEAGKFLSREFQNNIELFEQQIEPRLKVSRWRAALSMAVLEQLATAAITLLLGLSAYHGRWTVPEIAQLSLLIIIIVLVFHRFLPYLLFAGTRGAWLLALVPVVRALIYLALPLTLMLGFLQSIVSLTRTDNAGEQPEHPSEAVDALIEAGQDEGILEESDRQLIHSVVEFGDKIVREVMRPRPEIFAVPASTTVAQLTEMFQQRAYSRVPVYEGDLDHIVGIVLARDLLQVPDTEAHHRTVKELMKTDLYLVPETKRGSQLLREMQRQNNRMAIVIDEYGGVAGLVTVEDLVEEIVGELREEGESKSDIIRESGNSYVVPGNMDIDRLDDLFGIRLSEVESTTVSGLVTEIAGHIPPAGEIVEQDRLRFEVLESTDRRVERVRVSLISAESKPAPPNKNQAGIA
ncbi:MAG: hemolysin family protein [Candidatus Korobacteraceae bacterium]|jgi:CBS domain containing-hemolysin-like protein